MKSSERLLYLYILRIPPPPPPLSVIRPVFVPVDLLHIYWLSSIPGYTLSKEQWLYNIIKVIGENGSGGGGEGGIPFSFYY